MVDFWLDFWGIAFFSWIRYNVVSREFKDSQIKEKKEIDMRCFALFCALFASVTTGAFAQGFSVVTLDATAVNSGNAVLVGQIVFNPCVAPDPAEVQFVFNPSPGGNAITLSLMRYAPSNGSCTDVTDTVISIAGGLLPSTIYYYKLVASSNFRVEGNVVSFMTLGQSAPFLDPGYGTKPVPGSGNLKGAVGGQVTVVGENFGPSTQVILSDEALDSNSVNVVSDRLLTFQLPSHLPSGLPVEQVVGSILTVRVANNGLRSNAVPLVIVPAPPATN